jgi:lysophospholipase L1-like esterase
MKTRRRWLKALAASFGVAISGCGSTGNEEPVDMPQVKQNLEIISRARILFGHKSVGRDILMGLESLSREAGVPLRVMAIENLPPDGDPGLFHAEIGENGDPDSKCEVFSRLLTAPERPQYDLAMMKFCYVDLGRDTPLEASKMLDRYTALVERIKAERPDVTLVHASLPLRSDPATWKTPVKRLIGRATEEDPDNILRNAFNERLEARYGQEPFFDIAKAESTQPGGKRSSFEDGDKRIYTLALRYTRDGGHLNEEGRRHLALELVRVLADALRERTV